LPVCEAYPDKSIISFVKLMLAEGLTLRGALGVVVLLMFLIACVAASMQQQNSLSPLTGSGAALFLHSSTLEREVPGFSTTRHMV